MIEEGLSSRTTVWNDPIEGDHKGDHKNGRNYLRPCLESHSPVDLVTLMLERVMNLGENRIGMRITRSAWFLRDRRFPHS